MYRYQLLCSHGADEQQPRWYWETFREFTTVAELLEFARTDLARAACWGRQVKLEGPDGQRIRS